MTGEIRAVLFDAGGVLTRPVGGRWNPRYDFEEIVLAYHPEVRPADFPAAFAAGQRVLDAGNRTAHRTDYHRAMLTVLGVPTPGDALLHRLEAPAAGPVMELYPDVLPELRRLRADGVRMSVVSDTWAGFDEQLRLLGVAGFFDGVVVSEVLGCRKPDPRMYAAGRDAVGRPTGECLFIDDDPALVAAAVALGYRGVTLDRDADRVGDGVLTTLADLRSVVPSPAA